MPTSMVLYGVIVGVSLLCSHQFRYMRILLYSFLYNYTQMVQVFFRLNYPMSLLHFVVRMYTLIYSEHVQHVQILL